MITGLCLFTVREASEGFLISLRASNRYKATYLEVLERTLAFLAQYAEEQAWPPIGELTTEHIEDYLVHLAMRPKWFEERGACGKASQSYLETQDTELGARQDEAESSSPGHGPGDPITWR